MPRQMPRSASSAKPLQSMFAMARYALSGSVPCWLARKVRPTSSLNSFRSKNIVIPSCIVCVGIGCNIEHCHVAVLTRSLSLNWSSSVCPPEVVGGLFLGRTRDRFADAC